jgi:hypothetical protein
LGCKNAKLFLTEPLIKVLVQNPYIGKAPFFSIDNLHNLS